MNLLKAFPEIELFFQNESFSQEELLSFISELERQYSEKDIRKSASALIRLKLLQYDIAEKDNKQNIVARTKKIDFKSKRENKIHPMLSSLRKKSIEEIAYNIQWSTARLLRLIKQQGISKQRHNLLNDDELLQGTHRGHVAVFRVFIGASNAPRR